MKETEKNPDILSVPHGFGIVPLTEAYVKDAARIYTYDFLADEPTSRRHAPDLSQVLPYAELYVRYLRGKDLSFIATDEKTKDVAGFIFCVDLADDMESEGDIFAPLLSFFPDVIAMIDELEGRAFDRKKIRQEKTLHIFQIGVARRYRGMGISKRLIHQVIFHAEKKGFRQIIADCTNPVSKSAFERCGFTEIEFYPYHEFSRNGVRFFEGLEGGISLMKKDLDKNSS